MWTLAWWWMLFALPLPWLVRRFVPAEPIDRDAALKVPFGAEFGDLAGLRAPTRSRRWRLLVLSSAWVLAVLASARPQFVGEPVVIGEQPGIFMAERDDHRPGQRRQVDDLVGLEAAGAVLNQKVRATGQDVALALGRLHHLDRLFDGLGDLILDLTHAPGLPLVFSLVNNASNPTARPRASRTWIFSRFGGVIRVSEGVFCGPRRRTSERMPAMTAPHEQIGRAHV